MRLYRKNTPLPCEAAQIFYTMFEGQKELEITVTQGEDKNPQFVNKITTEKFELPPNRPAKCPIKVKYSYDVNQRMHCIFEDALSGRVLEVDFNLGENKELSKQAVRQKAHELEAYQVT